MNPATLVYNATPTTLGSLEIDCTVSESHQSDNDITAHPVEDSDSISDHIRPMQDTITIDAIISGTPVLDGETRQVEHTDPNGKVYQFAVSVSEETANGAVSRIEAARDTLLRIRNGGELITVVTGLRTYENMAIKSLVFRRDATITLRFTATLVQVKTVELKTTALKASTVSATSAKPHEKDGKKAGKTGPEVTALKRTGIAIGEGVARLFGGTP